MKRKLAIIFASALFSSAALAAAPAFEEVDSDNDGVISAAEAALVEGLDMTIADVNGDGMLSKEEYSKAAAAL